MDTRHPFHGGRVSHAAFGEQLAARDEDGLIVEAGGESGIA